MKLSAFLSTISTAKTWQQPVLLFHSPVYPGGFFAALLGKLVAQGVIMLPRGALNLSVSADPKDVFMHIEQTILGNRQFYWLGNFDELFSAKQRPTALKRLANYKGDNVIALYTATPPGELSRGTVLECPGSITAEDFPALAAFFSPKLLEQRAKMDLARAILQQTEQAPLDFGGTLVDYLELTSVKLLDQLKDYTLKQIAGSDSLQGLNDAFFARKEKQFFQLWSQVGPQYPDVFWLAYWSDQFWRAYHVIHFITQQQASMAKKMSFKLPYTFTNGGWKLYTETYFKQLFATLYAIDFKIKTGFSFCFFDYLFARHFAQNPKVNH